jgi:hypothetical protein
LISVSLAPDCLACGFEVSDAMAARTTVCDKALARRGVAFLPAHLGCRADAAASLEHHTAWKLLLPMAGTIIGAVTSTVVAA